MPVVIRIYEHCFIWYKVLGYEVISSFCRTKSMRGVCILAEHGPPVDSFKFMPDDSVVLLL